MRWCVALHHESEVLLVSRSQKPKPKARLVPSKVTPVMMRELSVAGRAPPGSHSTATWYGGTTSLGGIANTATTQTSSRVGVTAAVPLNRHQFIKASFSTGSYIRFGGDYQNLSVSWQYSWLGRPNQI